MAAVHQEVFVAGDAGTVSVDIDARGARVAGIDAAPGWAVSKQIPRRWARRRPTPFVVVYLRRGALHEWEVEVNQLADDSWEVALCEQWPDPRPESVATPGGSVRFRWDDKGVHVGEMVPAAGWVSRTDPADEEESFGVSGAFSRGTEEWEVLVGSEVGHGDQTVVQRGHSWRLELGPSVAIAP